MLEKTPAAVGHALQKVHAGLDKTFWADPATQAPETIQVVSEAFADGAAMPKRFTEDGSKTSPSLAWSGVPADAAAVAVIVEDPDSPTPRALRAPAGVDRCRGVVVCRRRLRRGQLRGPCRDRTQHHAKAWLAAARSADRARSAPLSVPGVRPQPFAGAEKWVGETRLRTRDYGPCRRARGNERDV